MPGAPKRNQNAGGSGLYSLAPTQRVRLPQTLNGAGLAPLARDMADGAMWLAERLAASEGDWSAAQTAALYAKVAHELYQLGGELLGVTGIKAAPLGGLKAEAFQDLLLNQSRALELILSQCATAMKRIKDREDVQGDGVVLNDGTVNPVLASLAGQFRSAGRMLRDVAANLAWRHLADARLEGAAERLLAEIYPKEEEKDV
jgi:hypothetical protein